MSTIKSNRKNALLTMGAILLLLGVAIPSAYANTSDPHVKGAGSGNYTTPICVSSCIGSSMFCVGSIAANIAFAARMTVAGVWSGTWSITNNTGATQASGTIGGPSILGSLLIDHSSYSLRGEENLGCGAQAQIDVVTISGACGTGVQITFASGHAESGSFTGDVKC